MIIECKQVKFYASYDEDAFFECLQKIKSVTQVKGKKNTICLTIDTLTDHDLENLIGLFRRYKVKMDTLETMLSESQKKLFNQCQKSYHINRYPAS
jgi:hypothetical protein